MSDSDPTLILFAKIPIIGQVKTRLCPPLTSLQAMQVAMLLIEKSLENAAHNWPGKLELCLWPEVNNEIIQRLAVENNAHVSQQSNGNLGDKMFYAINDKLIAGQNALIMGCDVPHCGGHILQRAFDALAENCNVIGPTEDGGYYCIGVNTAEKNMFAKVNWGSADAYHQTVSSCRESGIEFDVCLPRLDDLDTYKDLLKISESVEELKRFIS